MKETEIGLEKPVYLRLSILEPSKVSMYEFWYDYLKPKYGENAKPCFMDTDRVIVYVKTDDIWKYIAEDLENLFDNDFQVDRPLFPKGKNEKVIGLMKDELGKRCVKRKNHGKI